MLIAIWGRDGIGKSTLCDALCVWFARQGITAVIDTDLTQPTLSPLYASAAEVLCYSADPNYHLHLAILVSHHCNHPPCGYILPLGAFSCYFVNRSNSG